MLIESLAGLVPVRRRLGVFPLGGAVGIRFCAAWLAALLRAARLRAIRRLTISAMPMLEVVRTHMVSLRSATIAMVRSNCADTVASVMRQQRCAEMQTRP